MARSAHFPPLMKVLIAVIWPFLQLMTKRDRQGNENLPQTGGFVIAANHLSYVDPFVLSHWKVDNKISPRFLIKDTLFSLPVGGWMLKMVHQIPVYRGTKDATKALEAAIQAVRDGGVITIYPEGTMTRDPGAWPMSGRTGAVRIAHAAQVPLIPVGQWGPQDILWPYRKGFHWFPRKTMHIRVGEAIDLSDLGEEPSEEQLRTATERLMDKITELQAEIRGESPTTPRIDVHTLNKPKTHYESQED